MYSKGKKGNNIVVTIPPALLSFSRIPVGLGGNGNSVRMLLPEFLSKNHFIPFQEVRGQCE